MTYAEMITRLEREKELIVDLNKRLEQEVSASSAETFSLSKRRCRTSRRSSRTSPENRQENDELAAERPGPEDANRIRLLQQDLTGLWKKATV